MKIIPAVDILDGKVVRLYRGSYAERKEYSDDAINMAKYWQEQGAPYLHIVDLNGAKEGKPKNFKIIEKIIKNISIPIEVGGGIRTIEDIQLYINLGVDRVVLGTIVMSDLSFLSQKEIENKINKIAISFDARKEDVDSWPIMMAGTGGWHKEVPILDFGGLIDRLISLGVKYLNYTDRTKDGTLAGLSQDDISLLDSFLKQIGTRDIEVIYAGGVASLVDINKLANLRHSKLAGLIIGKALYENIFSLKEAQESSRVS